MRKTGRGSLAPNSTGSLPSWTAVLAVACIAALNAGGLSLAQAANDEIVWIGFSPDDRHLASAARDGHLRMFDLETQQRREITDAAADGGFQWAPSANRLAFCLRQKSGWNLALADPAGTFTLLTRDEWRDFDPAWSQQPGNDPQGAMGIYFSSSSGGGYNGDVDIRYFDPVARRSSPVIRGPHDQVQPRVSPDGRWLAAVSYQQGNPLILVCSLKTSRMIQILPPPEFRGDRLRLLLWMSDSRRLLCEVAHKEQYHLIECEVESERSETRDTSNASFQSVVLDRTGRRLLYVTGGKAYRRSVQPRWGRKSLLFKGLTVTALAVRHRDDRLAAVIEGSLLASASASGEKVQPLLGENEEYLRWGDWALREGRRRQGAEYYDMAIRKVRQQAGADTAVQAARIMLSRAPLLCRSGNTQKTSDYLREAERVLESNLDAEARERLYVLMALNEFVWNNRNEAAGALLENIAPDKRSSETALLSSLFKHPDKRVRQSCRQATVALWAGKVEDGLSCLDRLLQAHPSDPVVQAVHQQAWSGLWALLPTDVSESPAVRDKRMETWTAMVVHHRDPHAGALPLDPAHLDALEKALLKVRDTGGLKRMMLQYHEQMLKPERVSAFCRSYARMKDPVPRDAGSGELLARVLFDPEILARMSQKIADPVALSDIALAHARRMLVAGDYDQMKAVLADLERAVKRPGMDRSATAAYLVLLGEWSERRGIWDKAAGHYRAAVDEIEKSLKEKPRSPEIRDDLNRLLSGARARADLLDRAPTARSEITELLTIERGVGDYLMTETLDATSLLNGLHNYFALLGRIGTPWVKDLIYLKAGQAYRRLGRAGEAGFCLRVAALSRERFIVRRARTELSDLYREMEDPGLAKWYSPQ